MIKKFLLGSGAAAIALAGSAVPAYAGSSAALLQRLHEKGILTDDEYNALLAEEQKETQMLAAAPVAGSSGGDSMAKAEGALDSSSFVRMTPGGVGLQLGPATVKFSGEINGYYVHNSEKRSNQAVVGGVVGATGKSSSVRNGLLPGWFKVDVTTQQAGLDIGAHFGMYPGINSSVAGVFGANSGGQPTALATAGLDFRQTYMTIGRAGLGELKIGRDIGLFGSEGILNDITLLSSGSTGSNVAPGNTTLGRIGIGYIYTDFQPQITYTSPNWGGFQFAVGAFQPLSSITGPAQSNKGTGFQGKLTYDGKFGGIGTRLWLSGVTQKHNVVGGNDYTGSAFDTGAKVTVGPVALTGYYYDGSGVGTTVLNLFDTDAAGNKRDSHGFYGQALVSFGKLGIGGSYGESHLDYANAADALANPALLDKNSSYVAHLRYGLTSWVTLISEYTHTKSEAHNGNEATSNTVALGGILIF